MMKIIPVECPKCGATFEIDEGRNKCFCQYCGTQIMLDDGSHNSNVNLNVTYDGEKRTIIRDEARIKEAEVEIERKKLEIEEKESKVRIAIMRARAVAVAISAIALALSAWLFVDHKHIWAFLYDMTHSSYPITKTTFIFPLILAVALIMFLIATRNKTKK